LSNELSYFIDIILLIFLVGLFLFSEPEALTYEIFTWGDVGAVVDVRYYGVSPH
jgi:hypothetical protein